MNNLAFVVIFTFFAYAAADSEVNTWPCVNVTTHNENLTMQVSGCTSEDDACKLIKGTNHTVVFTFTATTAFPKESKFKVYGLFKSLAVPHGKSKVACPDTVVENSTDTCQSLDGFTEGTRFIHNSIFGVSRTYPTIQLPVRFVIVDRRKNNLFCQELNVTIEDEESTTESVLTVVTDAGASSIP